MKKLILSTVVLFALVTVINAENRVWTQAATGKKIEGEFVKMQDDKTVVILMRGKETPIPIAMLSEDDKKFIAEQTAPATPAPGDDAKPATPAKKGAIPEGETTVVLSGVHLCCRDSEELAVNSVENDKIKFVDKTAIKIEPDRKEGTLTVTAPTGKEAMVALSGLMQAGFYGKSDSDVVMIRDIKPDDFVSNVMSVRDIKICCGKCLKEVNKAVESVKGVEETTAKSGSSGFKVTGEEFKPTEVMQALRDAGFGGSYR